MAHEGIWLSVIGRDVSIVAVCVCVCVCVCAVTRRLGAVRGVGRVVAEDMGGPQITAACRRDPAREQGA